MSPFVESLSSSRIQTPKGLKPKVFYVRLFIYLFLRRGKMFSSSGNVPYLSPSTQKSKFSPLLSLVNVFVQLLSCCSCWLRPLSCSMRQRQRRSHWGHLSFTFTANLANKSSYHRLEENVPPDRRAMPTILIVVLRQINIWDTRRWVSVAGISKEIDLLDAKSKGSTLEY